MPRVLESLVRGDPGRPQSGTASYFGMRDFRRITSISDPGPLSGMSSSVVCERSGCSPISIDEKSYAVTRLRRIDTGSLHRPKLAFTTLDGVLVQPSRLRYLPVSLYRAHRRPHPRVTS